ncbi:MAG: transporter permease [Ferruginibacter sp.]|uniref:sulfite exporter TauE/SafE family protein n=1 Tax=Ferruginibacter sp. TaxID=1940288 RepID=UPI0026583994|nr:sulfite exporter TauE/SafE family protein [Ferruginibacter sp.]MDB5279727.1 transporter permease [Ferruginibacter sp.]
MSSNTPEEIIEEITHSHDVVITQQELNSSRRKVVSKYLVAIAFVLIIILFSYFFLSAEQLTFLQATLNRDNHLFYWMLLIGFGAEIVAGSMGMGYGVICTSLLLIMNVPPPVVSASIHSAEAFTSAAGTISHWQLGNINKKLAKALALPAIIGAVAGALLLTYVGERYAKVTKPFIAAYTIYLGIKILQNAFKKKTVNQQKKKSNITVLGLIGGFIDSFGGGGWGPLVTGTFIKNGHTPRFVIGSSTFAKCILTVASATTFIFTIGIQHWNVVAGLLIGGIVTAPFSAMLTAKLPTKKMFVVVGVVVIICGLITIGRAVFL